MAFDDMIFERNRMFCTYCGRQEGFNCHCMSNTPVSKIEAWGMYLVVLAAPPAIAAYLVSNVIYEWALFLHSMTAAFSLYLIVLALLTWIFKKSYLALFFGCHQRVERTFKVFNKPLNICARCTGIFTGVLLSNVLFILIQDFWLIIPFAIPLIIDGVKQKRTAYVSTNVKRFITGLAFGPSLVIIFTALHHMIILSIRSFS